MQQHDQQHYACAKGTIAQRPMLYMAQQIPHRTECNFSTTVRDFWVLFGHSIVFMFQLFVIGDCTDIIMQKRSCTKHTPVIFKHYEYHKGEPWTLCKVEKQGLVSLKKKPQKRSLSQRVVTFYTVLA